MASELDEREFELINIVGADLGANQRELSRQMDLSLGMVNMILRRMVSKGYIRIKQLNKRKVEYLLTPKGFSEKMRKSVKYTMKTIDSIGKIKDSLKTSLKDLVKQGETEFIILGKSDFAILVEIGLRELSDNSFTIQTVSELPPDKINGMLLICREENIPSDYINKENSLNLIQDLAKGYVSLALEGELS